MSFLMHTPEPWEYELIPAIKGSPGRFQLQENNILTFGWDGEEGIYADNPADVELMFAGPKLLAALREAVRVIQQGRLPLSADATAAVEAGLRLTRRWGMPP